MVLDKIIPRYAITKVVWRDEYAGFNFSHVLLENIVNPGEGWSMRTHELRAWRKGLWYCRVLVIVLEFGMSALAFCWTIHGANSNKHASPLPVTLQPPQVSSDPLNLFGKENKELDGCLSKANPQDPAGLYDETKDQAEQRKVCMQKYGGHLPSGFRDCDRAIPKGFDDSHNRAREAVSRDESAKTLL